MQSQELLVQSDNLISIDGKLKKGNTRLDEITKINVVPVAGARFTQARQDIVLANAFAFSLQIPVNNQKFITATYEKEPNIT